MTTRTITFRTAATITVSDTISSDEYFAKLLELWDESSKEERKDMLWDTFADSTPSCATLISQDYVIVRKDGAVTAVKDVVMMTAAQLIEFGIFY